MKKAYLAYLIVGSIVGLVGMALLVAKVNEVKTRFAQLDESITSLEATAVADAQAAQPAAPQSAPQPEPPKPEAKVEPAPVPKPAPETPVTGFAPSCSDSSHLRQADNPTPGGSRYEGWIMVGSGGRRSGRCLGPGTYDVPFGTVTILR